ncbi:hypothetical protein T484DRAFT_1893891, partial [Baffinella frigidus]
GFVKSVGLLGLGSRGVGSDDAGAGERRVEVGQGGGQCVLGAQGDASGHVPRPEALRIRASPLERGQDRTRS